MCILNKTGSESMINYKKLISDSPISGSHNSLRHHRASLADLEVACACTLGVAGEVYGRLDGDPEVCTRGRGEVKPLQITNSENDAGMASCTHGVHT